MYIHAVKTFLKTALVLVSVAILSPLAAAEDAPENYQTVGDVAIYLGVLPAEIIQGHPKGHSESSMHKGVPKGAHRDHIVVALFDKVTGKRIENAKVTGNVMEIGLSNKRKALEPMDISGSITYGNYFSMPDNNTYHIKIRIDRPGSQGVVEAQFTHRHFDD